MEEVIQDGFHGVIADEFKETDYQLLAGILELPKARTCFYEHQIQYNQKEINNFSCTLHGAIGALSDLKNYRFTLQERQQLLKLAIQKGFDIAKGWYIASAMDLVRTFWNERHTDDEVLYFRFDLNSSEFAEAYEKGYSIVFGYNGNGKYQSDFQDGKLDKTTFGKSTYGHCIRCSNKPEKATAVDNYFGLLKINSYFLPENNIPELMKNGIFQRSGFIFVDKSDFNKDNTTMPKIPIWALASAHKAERKGVITNWENPLEIVASEKAEWIFEKLGVLNSVKHEGGINLSRFAVLLDKVGLLDKLPDLK